MITVNFVYKIMNMRLKNAQNLKHARGKNIPSVNFTDNLQIRVYQMANVSLLDLNSV